MWLIAVVSGERPVLEKETRLRSDQVVKRAFRRQESVGWENLAGGRAVRGLIEVQEDWEEQGEGVWRRNEDARETVVQAMAHALLHRYEIWKLRCGLVLEVELPARVREARNRISELKGREAEVSARDRVLFDERNVPSEGDSLDRMNQWVRSVENSISRMQRIDGRSNRKMSEFLERGDSENLLRPDRVIRDPSNGKER